MLRKNAEELTTEPLREGLEHEFRIPDPRVPKEQWQRIDRLDHEAGEVIEIKPEHLEAEGWAEAKTYADYMNRFQASGRTEVEASMRDLLPGEGHGVSQENGLSRGSQAQAEAQAQAEGES